MIAGPDAATTRAASDAAVRLIANNVTDCNTDLFTSRTPIASNEVEKVKKRLFGMYRPGRLFSRSGIGRGARSRDKLG